MPRYVLMLYRRDSGKPAGRVDVEAPTREAALSAAKLPPGTVVGEVHEAPTANCSSPPPSTNLNRDSDAGFDRSGEPILVQFEPEKLRRVIVSGVASGVLLAFLVWTLLVIAMWWLLR